jgi:hypothetical protein
MASASTVAPRSVLGLASKTAMEDPARISTDRTDPAVCFARPIVGGRGTVAGEHRPGHFGLSESCPVKSFGGNSTSPENRRAPQLEGLFTTDLAIWSGRPDSNRRHSAWEADTLPTELLPLGRCGTVPRRPRGYHRQPFPSNSCSRRFVRAANRSDGQEAAHELVPRSSPSPSPCWSSASRCRSRVLCSPTSCSAPE